MQLLEKIKRAFQKEETMYGWVTKENIKIGACGSSRYCPVSLGLWTALGGEVLVSGGYMDHRISRDSKFITYKLSWRIRKWISNFDSGEEVVPFQFQIKDRYISMIEEEESCEKER